MRVLGQSSKITAYWTSSVGSIANDTKKCKQSAVRSSVLSSFASCLLLAYDENQQPEQHNQSMDWWKGKSRGKPWVFAPNWMVPVDFPIIQFWFFHEAWRLSGLTAFFSFRKSDCWRFSFSRSQKTGCVMLFGCGQTWGLAPTCMYIYITRYNPLIINRTWLTPPQPRSGPWRVLHQVRLEILPQQRTDVWTTNSGWSTPQGAASGEHRKRQSQKKKRKKSQQNSRNLKASTSFKSWRLSCNLPFQGPSLARQL